MRNDNNQLGDILQKEYNKKTGFYVTSDLPDKLHSSIDGATLIIQYPSSLIEKELNNYDSFEGWINVFRRWGIFDRIIFRWDKPGRMAGDHYQRFLERVRIFNNAFSSFFELEKEYKERIDEMDPDISVNEKDILESIIEIGWYFEMDKKLKVELPSEWTIKFTTESAVQFSVDKYITNTGQSVNVDNQIFAHWQLII